MDGRFVFAGILVLSGSLCGVASVFSASAMDTSYVHWSAAKSKQPPEDINRPGVDYYPLRGAPVSILSPTLIWLSFLGGTALIGLGVFLGIWAGVRSRAREQTGGEALGQSETAFQQRRT